MKYNRSLIFKVAHALLKTSNLTWSSCLVQSHAAYQLREKMKSEIVNFTFTNEAGEMRQATGSIDVLKSQGKSKSLTAVSYFDHDRNALRSFNVGRLWV